MPARRRKKIEEHENLERWLVSYADFITLLFAFFVVMYAISSLNEGKYKVLSESLVNAFRNAPSSSNPIVVVREQKSQGMAGQQIIKDQMPIRKDPILEKQKKQTENLKSVAKDVHEVMAPLIKEGQVRVAQTNRGVVIEINASVLFASGQAVLNPDSTRALSAVARVLGTVDNPVQVEGHTDNMPISTPVFPSNWELSAARASSVVRLFTEQGVKADRLVAVGYGDNHPVEGNDTPEGRSRNRRVAIMIHAESEKKITEIPITGSPYKGEPAP